jgi:hypothetical protein
MFIYPTSYESMRIEPDLIAAGRAGRLGFDIMPFVSRNAAKVRWTQQDNYFGLQQLRGMDGQPTHVQRVGEKTYEYEPGVFGEFIDITETELTNRAGSVDVAATPIDVSDLVVSADAQLIGREFDRMESSIWALLSTGTISIKIAGVNGIQVGYTDTYPIQTFTAGVAWGTFATAVPIRNYQSVQQLGLGHTVDLGAGAISYMNSVTSNNLLNNQNANDLAGRRIGGGNSVNTLADVNKYFLGQNLPQIQVYDGGYIPVLNGSFTKFIPDNKSVVVGKRPSGARVGEYQMTRNASNGFKPGSYRYIIDRANGVNAEKRTPANLEVHRGHNGGPAIYFPSAVVLMNV